MRISTGTLYSTNIAQLDTLQSNWLTTQQQASSGLRIQTPADDPAAAAQVLQMTQTQSINTQYTSNINAANSSISLADGTLQSVDNLLVSIQSAAVGAGNSSLSNTDRQTIANTLQSSLTQLIAYANTTDSNGNYIFGGFKGSTQPFVQTPTGIQYVGDNGQNMIQVSQNQQVATSDSGAGIFMNIKNGNGSYVAGTATTGSSTLTNSATAIVPFAYSSGGNATFTVDGTAVTVNQDVTVGGTGSGPGTLAAAIQAGLTAAGLNSYSVSAAAGGGLQITNAVSATAVAITNVNDPGGNIVAGTGTPGNSGTANISSVSTANPAPTSAQLGNSYQLTFSVAAGVTTYAISGADSNGVALPAGALPSPSSGLPYTSGQAISFNGVQVSITGAPANGDQFTVAPSANESAFTTVSNLINTLKTKIDPNNPASQAAFSAGLKHAQDGLNNALSSVLTAQTSLGARGNQLDALKTNAGNLDVQYQTNIANLQNVDMNAALSNLSQEKLMLTAAQQSFVQIEGLSMFTYLR